MGVAQIFKTTGDRSNSGVVKNDGDILKGLCQSFQIANVTFASVDFVFDASEVACAAGSQIVDRRTAYPFRKKPSAR